MTRAFTESQRGKNMISHASLELCLASKHVLYAYFLGKRHDSNLCHLFVINNDVSESYSFLQRSAAVNKRALCSSIISAGNQFDLLSPGSII